MNIWIFNHYAVGPGSNGITRHYDISRNLVKFGHNVTIFAASFNHQSLKEERILHDQEAFKEEIHEGVNFVWIKTFEYERNNWRRVINMLDYSMKAYLKGRNKLDNPDIVIGSLMHPLAAYLGYKVARKKKAFFIFEERDLWPQSLIDLGKVTKGNPIVKILSALELYLYKKADKIIVLFDKAPVYVKSRGIDEKKIIYLPNGVEITEKDIVKENIISELHIEKLEELKNNGKKIIMYTGAHSLANYLEAKLEIAEKIDVLNKDIHFVLIGDGPDKKNIMAQAKARKINNITFLPPVNKESIPFILEYADFGLITLRDAPVYEWGISLNKTYDYMAAKLPVIMLTSLSDTVIEKERIGIVSDNVSELVKCIIKVINKEVDQEKMGNRAYNYVLKNHTWKNLAGQLDKELSDLIK